MPVAAAKVAASWVPPCSITTKRQGTAVMAGGNVEPVGAGAGGVGVGEGLKPARRPLRPPGLRAAAAGGDSMRFGWGDRGGG